MHIICITVYIPAQIKSCQNSFSLDKINNKTLLFLVGYYPEVKIMFITKIDSVFGLQSNAY